MLNMGTVAMSAPIAMEEKEGAWRAGEAKDPGPPKRKRVGQLKVADFFVRNDHRDMWAQRHGYQRPPILGDGNCLYAALGPFVGQGQKDIRMEIAGAVNPLDGNYAVDPRQLEQDTLAEGVWEGGDQTYAFTQGRGCVVRMHSPATLSKSLENGVLSMRSCMPT